MLKVLGKLLVFFFQAAMTAILFLLIGYWLFNGSFSF